MVRVNGTSVLPGPAANVFSFNKIDGLERGQPERRDFDFDHGPAWTRGFVSGTLSVLDSARKAFVT